ncbi:DUF77-domain-containing protein [Fistulina hepatica ATCC 64428]|nr:DUF77-domain-containing protein [Fistulina hepatica ATCC 64428]
MSSSTSELYAVADFCLIPMGLADPSVAEYIAECQRVLKKSGLKYTISTEGSWSEVTKAIRDCHAAVHAKGCPRIATDIRIGTRTDREVPVGQGNKLKVARVEQILADD